MITSTAERPVYPSLATSHADSTATAGGGRPHPRTHSPPPGSRRPHLILVRESAPRYGIAPADASSPTRPSTVADGPTRVDDAPDPDGRRADELLALGDRIGELARSIQVAEAEMMRLLVEFDDRRGWADAGWASCAEWLAWRIGIGHNAARERMRTARALADLPQAAAAMAMGELSFAKARALTRVATPESESALLALARAGSAAHLERVVRAWKAMDDARELTLEEARHRRRHFSVGVDDDGGYRVRGRLDPEAGAVLMRAVEAAADALYRAERTNSTEAGSAVNDDVAGPTDTTPAQRRADAVGLLAERALAAGFGDDPRGARADRYQVLLHVEPDTLRADRPSGRSDLDGVRVCRETARRLTCDAAVARVEDDETAKTAGRLEGPGPSVDRVTAETAGDHVTAETSAAHVTAVTPSARGTAGTSLGRRTRTVPPALRRALQARDRGCRFPGCGSRFTEAHHIVHWADGGPTTLANLVLLCRRHHRHVHEHGARICLDRTAAVVFFAPDGRAITGAPAPTAPPTPRLSPAPPCPAPYPGAARFRRDRDIPWSLEARAREALDSG